MEYKPTTEDTLYSEGERIIRRDLRHFNRVGVIDIPDWLERVERMFGDVIEVCTCGRPFLKPIEKNHLRTCNGVWSHTYIYKKVGYKKCGFGQVKRFYGNRFKTYEEYDLWSRTQYKMFRDRCDWLTRKNLKKYKPELYEKWKSSDSLEIDHIYPISLGCAEGMDINVLCHTENLQLLEGIDNRKKSNNIESLSSDYISSLSITKGTQ